MGDRSTSYWSSNQKQSASKDPMSSTCPHNNVQKKYSLVIASESILLTTSGGTTQNGAWFSCTQIPPWFW